MKRTASILLAVLLAVSTSWASIALVSHVGAGSTNNNSITTGAIDTTGANLIVLALSNYGSVTSNTVSDSKSNTWTPLTVQNLGSANPRCTLLYSLNPTVGSGHTFTAGAVTNSFPVLFAEAFSGVKTTSAFDVENGATSSAIFISTGSVTPSLDNEVLVACLSINAAFTGLAIDSSFTISDSVIIDTATIPGAMAYKIQTTAGAENPMWTWTNSRPVATSIGTFKAATGGGSSIIFPLVGSGGLVGGGGLVGPGGLVR